MSDIFVSHAAPDKVLVDKFVDLLIATLNITSDRFFCTSLEGLGIKPGEDFLSTIKSNIQSPKLVVFLITPNYLRSQFCLCEMGASWAMSHEVVILKTSNVSLSDLSSIVSSNQIVDIQDFSLLGGVADKIKSILRLEFSTARWTVKCKQFLKDVEKILGEMEFDPIVSLDKYNALLQEKDDFEKQLTESYLKIDNLEGLVKRLEGAKDAEEVSRIKLESLAGYEAFTTLCESVKTCLKKFPRIVHDVLFYHFKGQEFPFRKDLYYPSDYEDAEDDGYISSGNSGYELNMDSPIVRRAVDAIHELKTFLEDKAGHELFDWYEEQYDHALNLSIKPFWKENFT